MILNEGFQPQNKEGGYYITDTNKNVSVTYKQARNKEFFLDAVTNMKSPRYKGDIAKFSYEHGIGLYFTTQESFAEWIGAESHYDEDSIFYIDGFPGKNGEFSGKKSVAFQLRVSNHPTIHLQWESTHARPSGIRTEFCLNLYINPDGRRCEKPRESTQYAVTDVTCDISSYYRGMPEKRRNKIDEIIHRIQSEKGAHIQWEEILFICGEKRPNITTTYPNGKQHREENFGERTVEKRNRKNFSLLDKIDEPQQPQGIPSSIPFSAVENFDDGDMFDYEGRKYLLKYTEDNLVAYPVKTRRGKEYVDNSTEIIIEGRINISHTDIFEMVRNVLKKLIV